MASRIVATVPRCHLGGLSDAQVRQVLELMTPALSILAGEAVFWDRRGDEWMALAAVRASPLPVRRTSSDWMAY